MYLPTVEASPGGGSFAPGIAAMREMHVPIPGILHLFAYRPAATRHLAAFTEAVMRGPSELSPGQRELIAALTSSGNNCLF